MNIPDQAIQAAAEALAELEPGEDWPSNTDLGGHAILGTRDDEFKWAMEQDAERALTAALPEIEKALRTQIAADLRAVTNGPTDWDDGYYEGRHDAARIAEEGAFHCCAHPKCPGGSICCCPDAEEGNTK